MTTETSGTDQAAEPDGYTCPSCQRNRHGKCSDPECECCIGNPED